MRRLSFRIAPAVQASAKERGGFRERGTRPVTTSVNRANLLLPPAAGDNAGMQSEPSKADPTKRKRRWFQFRLRTLLIFTLVCAIGSAWVAHRAELKRKEREAVEAIIRLGGSVAYDYDLVNGAKPTGPDWLRNLLGENFFSEAVIVSVSDAFVADAGLENLKGLPKLQTLDLSYAQVTDAGLVNLKGLAQLQYLYLNGSKVGDAGLVYLKGLEQLRVLSLSGTKITDSGLVNLKGLNQLQKLLLQNTKVTDARVNDLQKALPNCKIEH